ncbi:retrotransposon protein, putative, ty1-copia subclass [Tanacetum coccineum]
MFIVTRFKERLPGYYCSGVLDQARRVSNKTKFFGQQFVLMKEVYNILHAADEDSEPYDEFNKIVLDLSKLRPHKFKKSKKATKAKGDNGLSSARFDHGFQDFKPQDTRLDNCLDFIMHGGSKLIIAGTLEKEDLHKIAVDKARRLMVPWLFLSEQEGNNLRNSFDGMQWQVIIMQVYEERTSCQVMDKRLGHISEAGLQVLEKQGLFGKESLGKLDFCENCVLGKSHRVRFGVGRHTTQGVVDYVHSDLWGPSQVESLGGKRHLIVAGTPQQNGVAKRMNRTLMDKVRYLLIQSGLPKTFWAEATCTAAYLINRSPSTAIEKKTPMEMRSGHPSTDKSVEELQVEVELQRLNNHTLEEDQTDQEDGDDEDAGDQETNHTPDLIDYQLARDREPRTRPKPLRRDGLSKEEQDLGVSRSSNWAKAVRHTSIQVILALTTYKDYELEELDVKTTFLHGNLEEVIYMRQPPGYEQDDMLIAFKSKAEIGSTKSLLKKEFNMKDLGEAKKILDNGKLVKMSLGGHFKLSLKDCPVRDCDVERMSKVPYANAAGSLMYLMVCTRPDITYGRMRTNRGNHVDVTGFVDSDYAKDPDKDRFITGYAFLVQGCVVSWKATLQHVVALSTIEAEYMALTEAVKEAIWLRGLLEETKHINVRYHFIREVLEAKTVKALKVGTEHNVADALTKVVPGLKLQHCLELLNVGVGYTSITPIIDKIRNFEDLLISGKAILVDKAGNPLKKVECSGDYESEDEVASVDNDMTRSMASERVGCGTQSLLEQWRDSYGNGNYDEDPYDDDMYEGQDLPQEIQAISDNLDIRVRGRKKK